MRMHELSPPEGSTRERVRIGRGHGSGKVKTGGKGTKGQNARAGGGVPPYFEGGQLPLVRRLPYPPGVSQPESVEEPAGKLSDPRQVEGRSGVGVAAPVGAGVVQKAREHGQGLGDGEDDPPPTG